MQLTALRAGAYLHHLNLASPDPERLARFYADAMNMDCERRAEGAWLAQGPGRRVLFNEGPAKKLLCAGFALRSADDLAGLRAHVTGNGIACRDSANPLLKTGAFEVNDPDGNLIVFGLAPEEPPRTGLRAPIQHLTFATRDVTAIEDFYAGKLGFAVSDRVVRDDGKVMTCFMRCNHEHHNIACFFQDRQGIDHHSYEAGEWDTIRDWADRFAEREIRLMWGPGRHGPGNNLFIFIKDPDENWIEVSAELEVMLDRPAKNWPHAERTLNLWGTAILRA